VDDFQSRKPIDVIARNRPILILDEPQKMEGAKTVASLKEFKSALHSALLLQRTGRSTTDLPFWTRLTPTTKSW